MHVSLNKRHTISNVQRVQRDFRFFLQGYFAFRQENSEGRYKSQNHSGAYQVS